MMTAHRAVTLVEDDDVIETLTTDRGYSTGSNESNRATNDR